MRIETTIIYYTANHIPESFAGKIRANLLSIKGDLPLISVSQKPMDFGENLCVGDIGRSHLNIYRQALAGAKAAKTRYIALAEDDVLYSPEHFTFHVPNPGIFAYNMSVWALYTWNEPPIFSYKDRINLYSLICERELFIEAMEERFAKWPIDREINLSHWAEPGKYEGRSHLGVTERSIEYFYTDIPNVAFSHPTALSYGNLGTRKRLGKLQVTGLPYWGEAHEIIKLYV
jgi:hypothetical protein